MIEQDNKDAISQEQILKILQQIKTDLNTLTKQVRVIKAKQEIDEFFET